MKDAANGCRAKTYADKGGFIANITWSAIDMDNVDTCISVNSNYKLGNSDGTLGNSKGDIQVSDLHFNEITGKGCKKTDAEFICESSSPCRAIELKNVKVDGGDNMKCENAFGTASNTSPSSLARMSDRRALRV